MSLGLLFPGQGSQYVGMGQELADSYDSAARIFEEADEILGFNLSRLMWEGSESDLQETKYAQPAILTHSIGSLAVLNQRYGDSLKKIAMAAGHSLGEFSAHVSAGSLSFAEALKAVQLRADLMHTACSQQEGAMAAIIGLGDSELQSVCDSVAEPNNRCSPANFNSPVQIVISGDLRAVKSVMEIALQKGAKRAVQLNVAGAFHSYLMKSANKPFSDCMRSIDFKPSQFPVISNVTGSESGPPSGVGELLVKQLTSPVLWTSSIRYMVHRGISRCIEIGPGAVLRGLNRRITRDIECKSVGKPQDFDQLVDFLEISPE